VAADLAHEAWTTAQAQQRTTERAARDFVHYAATSAADESQTTMGLALRPRLDLLREVLGYDADVVSRTIDTHVAELRRKLEDDPSPPRYILIVCKAGYRLGLD
jgi:DNA-binding response OmpR family regulator